MISLIYLGQKFKRIGLIQNPNYGGWVRWSHNMLIRALEEGKTIKIEQATRAQTTYAKNILKELKR